METQLAMVVDADSCVNCKGCMVACKAVNQVPRDQTRIWVREHENIPPEFTDKQQKINGRGTNASPRTSAMADVMAAHFQPGSCMHCDNPICVDACPTGATYKDKSDGTIRVNNKLCIGCGSCIPACPYGARYRHTTLKIVDKCDFCEFTRGLGEEPACVTVCPTNVRTFGNIHDPNSDVAKLLKKYKPIKVINQKTDTKPNFYYINTKSPVDWPIEAKDPTPVSIWKLITPFAMAVVALNGLMVLAMLGKQLLVKEDDAHKSEDEDKGENKNG